MGNEVTDLLENHYKYTPNAIDAKGKHKLKNSNKKMVPAKSICYIAANVQFFLGKPEHRSSPYAIPLLRMLTHLASDVNNLCASLTLFLLDKINNSNLIYQIPEVFLVNKSIWRCFFWNLGEKK